MTMITKQEIIKKKADFFILHQIKVHIKKINGQFLNGLLLGQKGDGVYLLREEKFGETVIFLEEIEEMEQYRRVFEDEV